LLQSRNCLEVIVESASGDGGLTGDVALEVRCTAFLNNVLATPLQEPGKWRVSGEVAGTADRPLEVYVIASSGTLAYGVFSAGSHFELLIDKVGEDDLQSLRVELVNVSTVWYVAQVPRPAH
jgi:hypothetical protein